MFAEVLNRSTIPNVKDKLSICGKPSSLQPQAAEHLVSIAFGTEADKSLSLRLLMTPDCKCLQFMNA